MEVGGLSIHLRGKSRGHSSPHSASASASFSSPLRQEAALIHFKGDGKRG